MIDMRTLYQHSDYPVALQSFNSSTRPKRWSEFKGVHLKITNHRCPVCECSLKAGELLARNSGPVETSEVEVSEEVDYERPHTEVSATVDHYRPQKYYSFLEYEHKNYILMCSECNNIYKGAEFPLFPSQASRATCVEQLATEQPLIANPVSDNIYNLFKVVTRQLPSSRKVLELAPKHDTGYLHEKALETIKLFGIGDCEVNAHSNANVKALRVNLLRSHFSIFEKFINAHIHNDVAKMRAEIEEKNLTSYGFFQLILANNAENLT